jgi:lipoic acid synthetase
MLLGRICTRNCRFCATESAKTGEPPDADEGRRIALAANQFHLQYLVLTSVDRDDLPDRGAAHFAHCIGTLRRDTSARIEALTPDFTQAELESTWKKALPDVAAHNVETVERLQGIRDRRASWEKSLASLRAFRALGLSSKSSLMLGLGETRTEVLHAMDALREAGVDSLVLGQYLQPSQKQTAVIEYIHPETFASYAEAARERGFSRVVSSPLARTSYHAAAD